MRLVKKILLSIAILLVSVILVFVFAYNVFQNRIITKVVSVVNETIDGEVSVHNFNYSLFSSYPKAVVSIDSILLFESDKKEHADTPVLKIKNLYLKMNIKEILDGNYLLDEVEVGGGDIRLVVYNDSSLNLLNAIETHSLDTTEPAPIYSELTNLLIKNIEISYEDRLENNYLSMKLQNLSSNLLLDGDSLIGNVDLSLRLDSITSERKRLIRLHQLHLVSDLNANLDKLLARVSNGVVKLNLLEANIEGVYDGSNRGFIDFAIWAKHTDLSELAKMEIFKEENLPEIGNGELEIDALIRGYTKDELPLIEATAKLNKLEFYNRYGKLIENAGFGLSFKSNSTQNLTDAQLIVDSISIDFTSGGFFKGRVEVDNFVRPAFKLFWEASENLENIDKLIEVPEIDKMTGDLVSNGAISGIFNTETNRLLEYKGAMSVGFSNSSIVLSKEHYAVNKINGSIYLVDGHLGLEDLNFNANSNKISMAGRVENFLPYVLGNPTVLIAAISIKSNRLDTETLLAFDKNISDSTKYVINDFDISLQAELSSKALNTYTLIPTGKIEFLNFTALIEGAPPIANFNGVIEANEKLVTIKNFKGIIGKSHVDFSISVSNYADFFQSNTTEQIVVDVSLKSEKANAKDFFTINHKFVLPKNYEEEVLKNVAINAKIITTNTELQKTELLPELELQLTGLQFQTLYSPVVFKDIFVFGLVRDNNVYINSMFGKFGRSDVFMNAQFDNVLATKDTISRPLKSRVSFNAGVLDLDELIKLDETDVVSDTISVASTPSNPFAEKFPITDFQVNIGELIYFGEAIRNLKGIIKIDANNKIEMQQVSLESGEFGSFEFDGTLDASSRKEAILKSTIKISNVDLSNLKVKYVQNGEEVRISDHFEGKINGEVVADVPILPDFSFDLARLTGKIKVKMTDGALINYAPLEEMGKYFKNKDLNYIKFDELKNTMIFNGGKMMLPFMTINTTLGTINLMGFQTMDYDMSYDIQVPIKLVAGSALNSLFSAKKGDDGKDDKVKKAGKGKYVTVHISGSADQYKFKLGKKHVLTAPPGFAVD